MKKLLAKLTVFILTSAVSAGAFLSCGFCFRVPRGVTVDGIPVGGKTYSAACQLLRAESLEYLKGNSLKIYAGGREYAFCYPQINCTDNISEILHESQKDGTYASTKRYYLVGAEEIADGICADVSREKVEPYALFNEKGEPFTYFSGKDGAVCDRQALLNDINYSLNNQFTPIYARITTIPRTLNERDVRERCSLLCTFSTAYDEDNAARSNNIDLACAAINGTILAPEAVFSFNAVVGERSASRGYEQAKIISGGKYVSGLGGGVCQVSTTLYNAALLSGLDIEERHAHTLAVSYVPPSRDAMVSGNYFDLKFKNNHTTPVYIRACAANGKLTCSVYGLSDGWSYSCRSVILKTLLPPEPEVGAEVEIAARDGFESEGYLVKERGGVVIEKLVSRDSYAPVRGAVREASPGGSWHFRQKVTDEGPPHFAFSLIRHRLSRRRHLPPGEGYNEEWVNLN